MLYKNEVGPHTLELQKRMMSNVISAWVASYLTSDRGYPTPEFHLDIYDMLLKTKKCVVEAPRSFAKSTICGKNFLLFLACNYGELSRMDSPPIFPHRKCIIASNTGSRARELLLEIRTEMENNPLIRAQYGDLSGQKWTDHRIVTKHGFELRALGRGAQIRGFRPTLIIGDDLDDDEQVRSEEQRQKAYEWWDMAVTNTLDHPEAQAFVIGTAIHELALLRYIGGKHNWLRHVFKAYSNGVESEGTCLWPSKWSHERLQERKREIGSRAFYAEFMNEPQSVENPIFHRGWFKHVKEAGFEGPPDRTIIACDPAISRREGSDYTALVTTSLYPDGRIVVCPGGVIRGHWDVYGTVNELVKMFDMMGASSVVIETTAYQQALAEWLSKYASEQARTIPIITIKPDKDKERRARSVAPMLERGEVYFDFEDQMQQKLLDEMHLFPTGQHDDMTDAFVYNLLEQKRWYDMRQLPTTPNMPKGRRRFSHSRVAIGF